MAGVSKNTRDGRWQARWRDPGGRQRKKSFQRRADAQQWLDQQLAAMHRGQYVDPRAGEIQLAKIAESWAQGLTHLKESTAARYRGILRKHVLPAFGDWRLSQLRPSDVQAWVSKLHHDGLAPGTVRQCHRVLSLVLDVAVADQRIGINPARGTKLPRARRSEPRFLSPSEVTALTLAADRGGPVVAVLAWCGLRFGELAALRVRDLDIERARLHVERSVTEVGGRLVWSDPKTHHGRSVPFPRSLTGMLRDQARGKSPDDQLFTGPDGGALRLNNWRRRVFDPARARIGRDDITPHDLRHTAASLAIRAGANVKAVQHMLGHASAAMTLDVYTGLFRDDLDGVATALDGMLREAQPHGRVLAEGRGGSVVPIDSTNAPPAV